MNTTSTREATLRGVLDQWKADVDAHEPRRVASGFTDDAIFQGLHPYGIGQEAVADYYDSQPLGMTAAYRILETRQPADNLILGYLSVDFSFSDRATLTVSLSILITHESERWQISHYQVSRLDTASPA